MAIPEIVLSETAVLWISAVLTITVGFALKELLSTAVIGLLFKMNGQFREGDKVFIDGEKGVIVRKGVRQTVFGIEKDDNTYVWRYVYNDRIRALKIEKVIISREYKAMERFMNKQDEAKDDEDSG
jgi:small-conductance mechanosensitive channel